MTLNLSFEEEPQTVPGPYTPMGYPDGVWGAGGVILGILGAGVWGAGGAGGIGRGGAPGYGGGGQFQSQIQ